MQTIVLVDDSAANIMIYTKLSESIDLPVAVTSFQDPYQAIKWLRVNSADLVITDYKMPGMTGANLTKEIRMIPACVDMPIVVTTAYDDSDIRIEALEAGATDFLLTPVRHAEFQPRIRNLLKLSAHQRQERERAADLELQLEASKRHNIQLIRNNHEQLIQVIDSVPAMISATGYDGSLLFSNNYRLHVLGDLPNDPLTAIDHRVIETGETVGGLEETVTDVSGLKRVFFTTKSPLRGPTGAVIGVITTALDISERKAAETQLLYQVEHDCLTEIPNRYFVNSWLAAEIERNHDDQRPFSLYYVDLDHFKTVNDNLGHHYGDMLLQAVSQRLKSIIRSEDIVARLGGDEFAIIQIGLNRNIANNNLAHRIKNALQEPFLIDDQVINISASVGVTMYPSDGTNADELMKNADLAMYQVKASGRNNIEFFTTDMQENAQNTFRIKTMLSGALERQEFFLVYQPQRNLQSHRVVGFEALLRWNQTTNAIVSSETFLPIAEEIGMIQELDQWVLSEACTQAKVWLETRSEALRVAITLSAQTFRDPALSAKVMATLASTGLPPSLLELELPKGFVLTDDQNIFQQLDTLHQAGVRFSIEDFGAGYSALSYLSCRHIKTLQLNRSIISDLGSDHSLAIVTAIINLGKALHLDVLAECVESPDQLLTLRRLGCTLAQGHFIGDPMDSTQLLKHMCETWHQENHECEQTLMRIGNTICALTTA